MNNLKNKAVFFLIHEMSFFETGGFRPTGDMFVTFR